MAAVHGKGTKVLVDEYDLSSSLNSCDWSRSCETAETTTFGNDSKTYIPGLKDGTISPSGLFESTAGKSDPVLATALGAAAGQLVAILLQGGAAANERVKFGKSFETDYSISSPVGDVVSCSAEFQGSGGIWGGVLLEPLTAKTATGNGTANDNAASSTGGWVAQLHCTAASGTDETLDVAIEHSADNNTYVELDAFAQLTAVGKEQLSGTGTVNRYVRATRTIGGTDTPTFTYIVAFARK